MKRYSWLFTFLMVAIFLLSGCTLEDILPEAEPVQSSTTNSQEVSVPPSIAALEDSLESVFERVTPSVVSIEVLTKLTDFFDIIPDVPDGGTNPIPEYASSLGSGFVWDTGGHIITNAHVVAGAERITVTFYDGTIVTASLVGTDADSDLSVIKVDVSSEQLKPVKMADSTQLKVGQLAVAIGNPFGLQNTMTVGFISGLGRLLPATENTQGLRYSIPDIIQTDAAINPGNSGGVLLDVGGRVIGVTTAIATDSGSYAGVGFAIPSNIVQKVVPDLISTGHYEHPWIGVSIISLNPDIAAAMHLDPDQRGALVVRVTPDSPAARAGLQPSEGTVTLNGEEVNIGGDIILAFNGQTVKSTDDLITYLERSGSVGQTVPLTILSDGAIIELEVTLAARPTS